MSNKLSNEITVKVCMSNDEFLNYLKNHDYKETEKFSLDDYYYIPNNLDIDKLTVREILSKALIIRNIEENNHYNKKITFKTKNINELGEIVSQKSVNCSVYDIQEAKDLVEAIGYHLIMNIKEDDIVYTDGEIEFAVKYIKDKDILIEIETNEKYDTIDKLKEKIDEINLPIDKNDYFIKKAEIILADILRRE